MSIAMSSKPVSQSYLLWLQVAYLAAVQLSLTILFPYLRKFFSFPQMSLQMAIGYVLPILLLPFVRGFAIRAAILLSFVLIVFRTIYLAGVNTVPELYIFALLSGLPNILFWIPYEILFFTKHDTTQHGRSSALYFLILSGSGIIMPVAAGFLADHWGFKLAFLISAGAMIVPFLLALKIPRQYVAVTLKESIAHLKGVKGLILLEGFFWSIPPCIIALSLLTLTSTAGQFGAVSSIVALGALLASLPIAHSSDRMQNRTKIIYPIYIGAAFILLALGRQTSLLWFTVFLLIFSSLRTMTQPVVNALVMDLRTDHTKLYMARQFLLSIGRVLGFGLTWLFALTQQLYVMYVIYALAHLVYLLMIRKTMKEHAIARAGPAPLDPAP